MQKVPTRSCHLFLWCPSIYTRQEELQTSQVFTTVRNCKVAFILERTLQANLIMLPPYSRRIALYLFDFSSFNAISFHLISYEFRVNSNSILQNALVIFEMNSMATYFRLFTISFYNISLNSSVRCIVSC